MREFLLLPLLLIFAPIALFGAAAVLAGITLISLWRNLLERLGIPQPGSYRRPRCSWEEDAYVKPGPRD
ncbi:hypothetical protein [Sphingomonas radiodurans]|uniref:hypothetical protein n=1 Tax=Sphingomonas radiodurans TaxID=2890321 RepID=UPI001E65AEAF|nr:hypothetical protein [Sphingomonas radiodurans]WBH15294.1 hypothetical protein LLW23_10600 [Sphingomonas radiodurans]